MYEVELANMCMIEDKKTGKVLVQNRVKESWPGIAFPGGHIEHNESITDSVIREIWEETGLTVKNLVPCGVKNWCENNKRAIVFLFKTTDFEGELIPETSEGQVFFVEKKDVKAMKIADGFDLMFDMFEDHNINEDYITYNEVTGEWDHRLQ